MKKICSLVGAIAVAACTFGSPAVASEDLEKMQSEMLDPAVQVNDSSGVAISTAGSHIYILTAHHVINQFIDINNYGEGTRVEVRNPVPVKFFKNNEENFVRSGRIIARDPYLDLALLQVMGEDEDISSIANIFDSDDDLQVFEKSWSVGSGLGDFPFPTHGLISDISYPVPSVSSLNYILSTADITFGNSGGGLYVYDENEDRYELVGINTMTRNQRLSPFSPPFPMTHMGVAVSYKDIADFLKSNGWEQFIEPE